MNNIELIKELTPLFEYGVSTRLLKTLYPHKPLTVLKKLAITVGLPNPSIEKSNAWDSKKWDRTIATAVAAPHNDIIIKIYERLSVVDHCVHPIEKYSSIINKTIVHYMTHTIDRLYSVDGAFKVIHEHINGLSRHRTCDQCGNQFWTFTIEKSCSLCKPPGLEYCRLCGGIIYQEPNKPGRKREFCNADCRIKYHKQKRSKESKIA